MEISQLSGKAKATTAVVAAGVLVAAGAAGAAAATSGAGGSGLSVCAIASGATLHHTYEANGAWHSEELTQPDDITLFGRDLFVGFQNGVGPQGQAAPDGNLDSTVVEFTLSGAPVRQWDVKGKVDGLGADPLAGEAIATVNEDANSSLYAISPWSGQAVHYSYNKPLPHKGGTDSVVAYSSVHQRLRARHDWRCRSAAVLPGGVQRGAEPVHQDRARLPGVL